MSPSPKVVAVLMGLTLLGAPALGDEPYVYPTQGQSPDQMDRDKYDCYNWAKQQTGYDPANPPPPPSSSGGTTTSAGEGAAKGAAIDLVVGGLRRGPRRSPLRGAAVGAMVGGLVGGARKRDQQAQQQQQTEQQQQGKQSDYNRAFGACLEGRGYTVK